MYGAHCDGNNVGSTECVLLEPYYHKKQWATCLTDDYIRQLSRTRKKHHQCRDITATYCWYQCMLEINDIDKGPVYQNCECGTSNNSMSTMPTAPTLHDWCYSPDGTSCNWYRECLEKAKPCAEQKTDYAIKYAEKFCKLYQAHYIGFSADGQKWIDLVRRCLQVNLVSILRQWRDVTCEMIRAQAFKSHSLCYVYPNDVSDKYSFCSLPYLDMWRVFWTVKSGFVTEPIASLDGLLKTILKCRERFTLNIVLKLIKFTVTYTNVHKRDRHAIAWKLANSIALQFSWDTVGISWYAYLSNGTFSNTPDINILIASKQQLDLSSPNALVVDLNRTIDDVANAVENNNLKHMPQSLKILSFNGCFDVHCNNSYAETIPLPISNRGPDDVRVTPWLPLAFMTILMFYNFI